MTPEELAAISHEVGELEGWDFSRINLVEDELPWQFDDVVRQHLQPESVVLDLGTGGGEVFLEFSPYLRHGYGVDQATGRLCTAATNRGDSRTPNIAFAAMEVRQTAFRDHSFDVVLARYADYDVAEVVRLLRPGGVFITQQIGDHDTQNIFDTFGWGSFGGHWRDRFAARGHDFLSTVDTARTFEELGCSVLRYDEYNVKQYYLDIGSFVFFLKSSPLPWPFDPQTYAPPLHRLIEAHGSERGIETNAHRELLIVKR